MRNFYLLFILVLFIHVAPSAQIIDFGDAWKYYDNEQMPPNDAQGDVWNTIEFDDASWMSGDSELGYGDGDEATELNENTYTAYFRNTFTINDSSLFTSLQLHLIYDDGAVVYINGNEVWRVNMPTGSIDYSTFASGSSGDNQAAISIAPNSLLNGDNTIAIEIHQTSATSSDISFDFRLTGNTIPATLPDFGAIWSYYDNEQEPPNQGSISWKEDDFDDTSWAVGYGQLGYGDGDEYTTINSATLTGYFRHKFDVSDPSVFTSLQASLIFDDGAVIYLNGVKVWTVNMPTENINYNTFASSQSDDNELAISTLANTLVAGTNILAVEVHQRDASSSDLSFDFKLVGNFTPEGMPAFGSAWKYYDNEQEPPLQSATSWEESTYDDSSWLSGIGQLGYGDNDETTLINDQAITVYFRNTFTVDSPDTFSSLKATLLYDDGAVVYLNGSEIMRLNMDPGDPTYSTLTNGSSGDNATSIKILPNTLLQGENTIAVEIHQVSNTSSDISFDFALSGENGTPTSITRGPYLQKASDTQMTIKWRTDLSSECTLLYGTDMNNLTDSLSESIETTEHEITLTNLSPGTVYYYEIKDSLGTQKEAASDLYFKTHPIPNTEENMTAWILGDCGTGNSNARAVRDAFYSYIGTNHTDMMLFLGDNAYNDGTDQQYQDAIFENMYEDKLQNTIAWSCLGNHDGYSAQSSSQTGPYYDIFTFPTAGESGGVASGTEAYYSFDYGNVHFIILDSYDTDRSVGGAMYNWCLSDLQNTTAKWIVAMWHHPPYTKGSHDSDLESNLIQMRERFLPILEDNGVDLVLSGHSHSYERSYYLKDHYGNSGTFNSSIHTVGENGDGDGKMDGNGAYRRAINGEGQGEGTVYITTGSAGKISSGSLNHQAMFYSVSELGSCILEINTDTLSVKFLRETGTIDDYFTITKCKGLETVKNDSDSGNGSLRQKIADACALDTITFDLSIASPIILNTEITLDKQLHIKGNPTYTTLSGNNTSRIFNIVAGTFSEMENISFINGYSTSNGGAILNNGFLTLKQIEFENNYEGLVKKSFTNNGEIYIESSSNVIIKE